MSTASLAAALQTRAVALGTAALSTYSQWYHAGTFHNPNTNQWAYNTSGPASLCASMYRQTGIQKYLDTCTEAFDYAVDNLMDSHGFFVDEPNSGNSILETFVFGANLAWAIYILGPTRLNTTKATKWLNCLKTQINHVDIASTGNPLGTGDLVWYANGNWVADHIRMLYLTKEACKAYGDTAGYTSINALYERSYSFWTNPVTFDAKWTGYGYTVDTAGTWADGSNELGHFTEVSGGPPMPNSGAGTSYNGSAPFSTFDTDYTSLTIEHVAQWFVASRDYRALHALNALTNQYMTSVNISTWVVNVTGGSRHNVNGAGVYSPGLPVLALLGQRQVAGSWQSDTQILDQWDRMIATTFNQNPIGNPAIGLTRSFSSVIGSVLYACELVSVKL